MALAMAGTAGAQEKKPDFIFAMHGFLGGSLFWQDQLTSPGNGEQSWYVTSRNVQHKGIFGADVRQSLINFSLAGPTVFGGATPKAVYELDLSNQAGQGSYGDVSLIPRTRLAYAELNWGNATFIRFGQDHQLLVGTGPVPGIGSGASVGHVGYPISYEAGRLGWREPQFGLYQYVGTGSDKLELALQVMRSQWYAPSATVCVVGIPPNPASTPNVSPAGKCPATANIPLWSNTLSAGEYSGIPAFEGRVRWISKALQFYVAGHYGKAHRAGPGSAEITTGPEKATDLDIIVGQAELRLIAGPLTVVGSGYAGKNLAPFIANILQFQRNSAGDIHEWGAFGQIGLELTKTFSAWAAIGTSHPNYKEIRDAGLAFLQNTTTTGMLRWMEGGYAIGLEYQHYHTQTAVVTPVYFPNGTLDANQLMLSGVYFF